MLPSDPRPLQETKEDQPKDDIYQKHSKQGPARKAFSFVRTKLKVLKDLTAACFRVERSATSESPHSQLPTENEMEVLCTTCRGEEESAASSAVSATPVRVQKAISSLMVHVPHEGLVLRGIKDTACPNIEQTSDCGEYQSFDNACPHATPETKTCSILSTQTDSAFNAAAAQFAKPVDIHFSCNNSDEDTSVYEEEPLFLAKGWEDDDRESVHLEGGSELDAVLDHLGAVDDEWACPENSDAAESYESYEFRFQSCSSYETGSAIFAGKVASFPDDAECNDTECKAKFSEVCILPDDEEWGYENGNGRGGHTNTDSRSDCTFSTEHEGKIMVLPDGDLNSNDGGLNYFEDGLEGDWSKKDAERGEFGLRTADEICGISLFEGQVEIPPDEPENSRIGVAAMKDGDGQGNAKDEKLFCSEDDASGTAQCDAIVVYEHRSWNNRFILIRPR